ncbi:MAG: DUF262 domain-containing protein [Prevotella sp.]|nr:DUF262 domain-containing protein [Prevotella sp.]
MKYTPASIVENNLLFTIPIYQRLFEWDEENILTLMNDLLQAFEKSKGSEDYYIGMLTSKLENGCNELIDGQQRFTVLMLIACALKEYKNWEDFLGNNPLRLRFTSRPKDDDFLRSLIDDKCSSEGYVNIKMKEGLSVIRRFITSLKNCDKDILFAEYVFNHLCLFISHLPERYGPLDLNKYFERMNTSGKNLELHEILKVKLLKNLTEDVSKYMLLWNKLSDVDTLLIRKRNEEKESQLRERKDRAIKSSIKEIIESSLINGIGQNDESKIIAISEIPLSINPPKTEQNKTKDSHCALSFPYLLLQTLFLKIEGKIEGNISDFFKPNNLLETFQQYLPYEGNNVKVEDIREFMELLVNCRLALDICFIRPSEYGYTLDMNRNEDDESLIKLLMLQSMLFVSSSNYTHYRWFGWLMESIKNHHGIPSTEHLFEDLKTRDDLLHKPIPTLSQLSYGDIRYWFWRLDFYIWLHRNTIFSDSPEALKVADNYIFRRNRSIEHIAPQTPESDSVLKWNDTPEDIRLRDSFGNLVMISQGLNSTLSNASYQVKTAHVRSYINGAKSGSIESLKLLVVHQDYKDIWDKTTIVEHGDKMYQWLIESYQ